MSGVIAFAEYPEQAWVVAGWAFRQVLDDVASRYPQDSEIVRELETSKAIGGLHVYRLEPELKARVTEAMRLVVTQILAGRIQSGINQQTCGNSQTIAEFTRGLEELLKVIPC